MGSGQEDLRTRFEALLTEADRTQVTDAELRKTFGKEYKGLVQLINEYLRNRRLQLFQNPSDNTFFYKIQSAQVAKKYEGLDQEHMHVLQEIAQAGNTGIWIRSIKTKTRLPQHVLNKVLKALEQRELVKAVKSITSKNKKVYVLFDVVPAREHTGGPWYTDQEFDEEFVRFVSNWVLNVIKKKGSATIAELTTLLQKLKISKVDLSEEDIKSVVDKLLYEGEIEEYNDPQEFTVGTSNINERKWKVVSKVDPFEYLTQCPCGVCPIKSECTPGGIISPVTCTYMNKWLGSTSGLEF